MTVQRSRLEPIDLARQLRRDLAEEVPFLSALVGNFVLRLAGAATGLLLTLYFAYINRQLYPVSATELGFIASGYYLVEMVSAPLFGALSDRHGWRLFLVLGPLLGFVAVQITASTTVLGLLFVARVIEGLAGGSSTPALLGFLSNRTTGDAALRGRVMSRFEVGTTLGLTLGTVAGSLLWQVLQRLGFEAVSAIYLVAAFLFWRADQARKARLAGRKAHPGGLVGSFRRVLAHRPLLRFAPAWLIVNAIVGLWLLQGVFQMTKGHAKAGQYLVGAFSTDQLTFILGGYTLIFAIGGLAWGHLIGRVGELRTMRVALGGLLVAVFLVGLLNHSGGPGLLFWIGLAGASAAAFVESGFGPAAVSYLAAISGDLSADRGLMMGLYSVVLGLGNIVGSWIGGPVADRWGIDGILALTLALCLIATVWLWWLVTRPGPSAGDDGQERSGAERAGIS